MEKTDFRYLFRRTRQLLMAPEAAWNSITDENNSLRSIFRSYLIPLTVVASCLIFAFCTYRCGIWQAMGHGVINLIAAPAGTWIAYIITREYLINKLSAADSVARNLTIYSAAIFILFHSLAVAFGNGFFSQAATLLSLIFIRSLYIGIKQTEELQFSHRTNILIITSLSIICFPVIITHLLMIVFRISAFNI